MTKPKKRELLFELLGDLPPWDYPIEVRENIINDHEYYRIEKLTLDFNGEELVPAYLLLPNNSTGPFPVILYHHAHGLQYEIGKEEVIEGRSNLQSPPYGEELTKLGIAVFCIDTWAFGERKGRTESSIFKDMIWHGKTMLGMMLYDSIRSIDYLSTRPEIDHNRIGTLGMSMGSTLAWWTGALDTRIKLVVDICCLTDFHTLLEEDGLDRQGLFYFVPGMLKHFSTADINGLIAPRPHLSLAGIKDELTPVKGLDMIEKELIKTYSALGAKDAWKLLRFNVGHEETKDMRDAVLKFINQRI